MEMNEKKNQQIGGQTDIWIIENEKSELLLPKTKTTVNNMSTYLLGLYHQIKSHRRPCKLWEGAGGGTTDTGNISIYIHTMDINATTPHS